MSGLQLEDIVPGLGMVTGKGILGNVFGKASELEDEKNRQQALAAADAQQQKQAAQQAKTDAFMKNASGMKKGGSVKGSSSASKRGDGAAQRGKTRGRMV